MNTTELESRIKALEDLCENLRDLLLNSLSHSVESFKKVDHNFEILEKKVDALRRDSQENFDGVGVKLDELMTEVQKIEKVSNYSDEYENLVFLAGRTKSKN